MNHNITLLIPHLKSGVIYGKDIVVTTVPREGDVIDLTTKGYVPCTFKVSRCVQYIGDQPEHFDIFLCRSSHTDSTLKYIGFKPMEDRDEL